MDAKHIDAMLNVLLNSKAARRDGYSDRRQSEWAKVVMAIKMD